MSLRDKTIVVTGGSRGLGLGLVEALVDQGAKVTVVARDKNALASVKDRLGVALAPADVTDEGAAQRILAEVRPDILVLNAGATPPMGRLDQLSWADFHRAVADRREGRALLDPGRAQPSARAGFPRPRWLQRCGRERIAALGRLCRRQAHALGDGQHTPMESPSKKALGIRFQGDPTAADHQRDWGRRQRLPRLRPGSGPGPRGVPGEVFRRAAAAPQIRRPSSHAAGRSAIRHRHRLWPQGRYRDHGPRGGGGLNGGLSLRRRPRATLELLALAGELRPELHRYCARMTGSVVDGEDVVQDALARAFVALDELEEAPALRTWLFRIAHNRALDLMRSRAIRDAEPIEAATYEVADPESLDPVEVLMRREAVETAVSRFVQLPTVQRSVVILKDVLDQSLEDIAALLDLTVNAVKAHLARGRARLKAINAEAPAQAQQRLPSPAVARYVALFNRRDWDGLRAMLADDVRLIQSSYPLRAGRAEVRMFFSIYAGSPPALVGPARSSTGAK